MDSDAWIARFDLFDDNEFVFVAVNNFFGDRDISIFGYDLVFDDDLLVGFGGTDVLDGGDGNDRLVDGDGMDFMIGGTGADVFVFTSDERLDVVLDFDVNLDLLDLSGVAGLNNFSQLEFHDLAIGTLIRAGGETIWIPVEGLSSNAFDSEDFVF